MKITRQRLKNIIMEEIALQEATPAQVELEPQSGNAPANQGGMDEITEEELEEGLEMITPENIKLVADVVAQMGMNFAPGVVMAALAMKADEARRFLMARGEEQKAAEDAVESPEMPLEEEQEGTLEELITQAIQEELAQMASKNVK